MDFCGFLRGFVGLFVGNCVKKCESFVKVIVNLWRGGGILWEMCGFYIFIGR
jgi:hypothetical protein